MKIYNVKILLKKNNNERRTTRGQSRKRESGALPRSSAAQCVINETNKAVREEAVRLRKNFICERKLR